MITKLGFDVFGDMAIENFKAEGIDTDHVLRSREHPTGAALILVKEGGGQNSIMVIPGACGHLDEEEVVAAIRALAPAAVLVLQLETNFEAVAASLKAGRQLGMKIICNPAPARPIPAEYYPMIDFLTPNETEASALSGIPVDDLEGAERAARKLRGMGAHNVIITLGDKGALILPEDREPRLVPSRKVEAVDTTGAGDSFTGALALALAEGEDIDSATAFANAAAALSVTRIGTAPAMPLRGEIDAFIAKER
jgi:ribokinase